MIRLIACVGTLAFVLPAPVAAAPEAIGKMIEAHGGMAAWRSVEALTFTDSWNTGLHSTVTTDLKSRRALLEVPGTEMAAGGDGERVWTRNWTMPMPARFLLGLNFYFLDLPWLTQDPGVNLAEEGTVTVGEDPTEYLAVRMTFDAGVGDTPGDYYLLYIDPETYRLHGCEYIVTYRALLPKGAEHTPEHDLIFTDFTDVEGLLLPTGFTIYEKDGSVYAVCEVAGYSTGTLDESRTVMPDDAVVDGSEQ